MDAHHPVFREFRAYGQLSEEMIARATKEDLAEAARILAMQAAHYARKYGEMPLPDLTRLLSATTSTRDDDSVGILRDGTAALVGALAMVTGVELTDADSPAEGTAASSMYAITRHERRPGIWFLTVLFQRQGKRYYKSFYDFRRGGSKKALAAAIAWRNAHLAAIAPLSKRAFCQLKRSTNRSGVPGVRKIWPKNQPLGCWQARLRSPDGREHARTFSVKKYGERAAYKLAVAARKDLLKLVEDQPYLQHRVAKRFAAQQAKAA